MLTFETPFYIGCRIRDEKILGSGSVIKHHGSPTLHFKYLAVDLVFLDPCGYRMDPDLQIRS
jgi:hypothetical protein